MKKIIFALIFVLMATLANSQTDSILLTIGNKKITKSDFEYLYLKNRYSIKTKPQSVETYLDLYKKFKLKVIEAESLGYDTLEAFRREYYDYRSQLAVPYLVDRSIEDSLSRQAYNNLLEDVELSHILLLLPPNATPSDTINIYKKALEAIKRLKKESFEKIALSMSDDAIVKDNKGRIGWITGQMFPYSLERVIFSLPLGKVSQPIRTNYGYHIIKVSKRRPAVGRVQVAHIAKLFSENATDEQKSSIKDDIFKIYNKLKNGSDFSLLASEKSDDKASANNGGIMNPFGVGRMVEEFENAAFALKNKDDISDPIKSQYGWHIIKLIEKKPIASFEDTKPEILKSFNYDGRADICRQSFVDKLKKEYNFKFDDTSYQELMDYAHKNQALDSNYLKSGKIFNKTLFTIKNRDYTQRDYIIYIFSNNNNASNNTSDLTKNMLNGFINDCVFRFEDSQLEQKYPEFKHLLQEYHDGILLFNISNDKVWQKAVVDTAGIEKFFKDNITRYAWNTPHYKGRIFYCKNQQVARKIQKDIKKLSQKDIAQYIENINRDTMIVDFQRGIWEKGENPIIDKLALGDNNAQFSPTEKYPYVFVYGKILNSLPESYTDLKGIVVTDYQDYLEHKWIEELEKKYSIKLNKNVLEDIKKDINRYK